MGGADSFNLAEPIIRKLHEDGFEGKIAVITPHFSESSLNRSGKVKVKVFNGLNSYQLRSIMLHSRIGLFPASTISIEASSVRLPHCSGYFVDNQIKLYEGMKDLKMFHPLGSLRDNPESEICRLVIELIENEDLQADIIRNQRLAIDHLSGNRLRDKFIELEDSMK
jgi:spore coat polysaccharide biosynthesis predicted glycosyltransferase SpsG